MVSSDGRCVAWHQENSLYESSTITVLNLETGARRSVSAQEGYYIRALGFMGTDFIYGEARQSDVQQDIAGNMSFPMGRIVIQDEYGQEIRSFDYGEICSLSFDRKQPDSAGLCAEGGRWKLYGSRTGANHV